MELRDAADLAYDSVMEPDLAKVVRAWRKRLGLTQAQAARAIGVHENTIRNYEKGLTLPDQTVRLAMSAFEAGLPELITETAPTPHPLRLIIAEDTEPIEPVIHLDSQAGEPDQSE